MSRKRKFNTFRLIFLFVAVLILLAASFYLIIQLTLPDVKHLKNINPQTTALMDIRQFEAEQLKKRFRLRQSWVRFGQIPDLLKKTIRISEDAGFYLHEGVDFNELEESIRKNIEKGKFARGGSTITQQLAKNLYLNTEKSIWRKIREYFIAKELESTLSKNRIFHIYLNIIELGNGIFGVQAASLYYFKKPVSILSTEEMVRLTAIIPRPLAIRPDSNHRWLLWKCRWITEKLLLYKYIDKQEHDYLQHMFTPQ